MIETQIIPIGNSYPVLENLLKEKFNLLEISPGLIRYLDQLKRNLWLFIEYPYVDRLYRDAYYHYFSSKHVEYHRNTIRISFFDEVIKMEDFRDVDRVADHLQKNFCGFLVVRPIRKCIGRNVISPRAIIKTDFYIRTTTVNVTINGVKLFVEGFPHSSQDAEAMTCAETTVWSLIEYFGTKYSEYNTILPSSIRNLLNQNSTERLLPSLGLTVPSISYLIKNFGFGSKKYAMDTFTSNDSQIGDYYQLLHCYIESGIPVIICLMSKQIGHAAVCIGRKSLKNESILGVTPIIVGDTKIYDINKAARELVIIDDNHPPYQVASPESPDSYYESTAWRDCKIGFFIVPLHHKVYLEATQAKEFLYAFLNSGLIELPQGGSLYVRLFLTSGRSLKYNLGKNKNLDRGIKDYVIALELPKFVWVAEFSNKEDVLRGYANGLILFDATETDFKSLKTLLFAALNGKFLVKPAADTLDFKIIDLPLQPFHSFDDNLKFFK